MQYLFSGKLCGRICPDQNEPIYPGVIRLYRIPDEELRERSREIVANPKRTFAILSDEDVQAKEDRLLAETDLSKDGSFEFAELDPKQEDYFGEAFVVDVRVEGVQGQSDDNDTTPVQVTLTTVQPDWQIRRDQGAATFYWDYCVSQRFWCALRELFDAWVICGRVTSCEEGTPLANMTVRAFDADITQDDEIGNALTDANGRFRIDYSSADFKATPIAGLNVELVGGPDLFFSVENSAGVVRLEEDRSRGRDDDRENRGPCFSVALCVEQEDVPPPRTPAFTNVGQIPLSGIDDTTGLVMSGDLQDFAFFGGLRLNGDCPQTDSSGNPLRYRFQFRRGGGSFTPITGSFVQPHLVGTRRLLEDRNGDGTLEQYEQNVWVVPNASTSVRDFGGDPPVKLVPDAQGWVEVDQSPDLVALGFRDLMRFNTRAAVPGGGANGATDAGDPVAPSDQKNGDTLEVLFEVEAVGGTFSDSVTLDAIRINNWREIRKLSIRQLATGAQGGCTPITDRLDIDYTVDHEFIRNWGLRIASDASLPARISNPLASGTTSRGGNGTYSETNMEDWVSCSYRVTLTSQRALTTGDEEDDGHQTQDTFCL